MSFVVTTPEIVTTAAGSLATIGSTLEDATAAAAGSTTGVAAAAADEVSLAISQLFGSYGQEFQAISAQAAAFHTEFTSLLNGSAAAYLGAEIANAGQNLANTVSAPAQTLLGRLPGAPAAAAPAAGPYEQLWVNTSTNLQALGSSWAAHPFPLLSQILANQQRYGQQIAAATVSSIQNIPNALANLPTTIQAGIQELVAFPWAQYIQHFLATQIGFAQTFFASLGSAAAGIVVGLPNFGAGLQTAFQALLAGDYYGAVEDAGEALANLMITGFNTSNYTVATNIVGFPPVINISATAFPVPLGPLPDFFTAVGVFGQEAQYLTNLMPPGSVQRQMSQNFTNVLNTLTTPSIEALATLTIDTTVFPPTATGSLSGFFGLPLVLTYASLGPPITILTGLATSATSVQQALAAGNFLGALGAIGDAPAVVANTFLNGHVTHDVLIPVPSGIPSYLAPPLPTQILITVHLPFDGILVPPHHVTATVNTNSQIPIPGVPFDATILGTPFMGLAPLLLNYVPQQLALAITPAA